MRNRQLVYTNELQRLRAAERRLDNSFWKKTKDKFNEVFDGDPWYEVLMTIFGLLVGAAMIVGLIVLAVSWLKDCSGSEAVEQASAYQAVRVGDKWGIGKDAGNLSVAADYDTVFAYGEMPGRFFIKRNGMWGNAYVDDNESVLTPVKYNDMFSNGSFAIKGWYKNPDGSTTYDLYSPKGQLVKSDLSYIGDMWYGYAWAQSTSSQTRAKRFSIISPQGKLKYTTPNNCEIVEFRDEIGFYRVNNSSVWQAVDTAGRAVFTVRGDMVYPYTMGVAPVVRGTGATSKLGFIDKTGATVIPFDYHKSATANGISFGEDSTIYVQRNGKLVRLHRNGSVVAN
ncbi:MAG: hypothetical protein K2L28_01375 [Muribaculaceae bacterium]|nr:hypothetical protein [Muribaculaceae bacterium]